MKEKQKVDILIENMYIKNLNNLIEKYSKQNESKKNNWKLYLKHKKKIDKLIENK